MATSYSVLGVTLQCSRPLPHLWAEPQPGLPASRRRHTVEVDFDHVPAELSAAGEWELFFESPHADEQGKPVLRILEHATGDFFRLSYSDGTEFFVDRAASRVWARWSELSTLEDVATYLLGPVLGFVLRLRGVICLHASAVVIDGRAVAVAGPPGAGKSTTAAAFAQREYLVLADDIVALQPSGSEYLVQTDCSLLRLWPESSEMLYGSREALPRLATGWGKRFLDIEARGYRTARDPHPLETVYLLGGEMVEPERPVIRELPARQRLLALVANSYANLFPDAEMRAYEFDQLSRLVGQLSVRRIHQPLNALDPGALCELIAADYRHQRTSTGFS